MKYVIERMNENTRQWWNGSDWSDVDTDAEWYSTREEAESISSKIGGEITGFDI